MGDTLQITRLTSSVGARVEGVDLSREIPDAMQLELQQALWDNYVLVFPGPPVGMDEQIRLASCFGEVQPMPVFRFLGERNPAIAVDNRGGGIVDREGRTKRPVIFNNRAQQVRELPNWHTDVSFTRVVPQVGTLRAEVLPPVGGDTCFASLCAAYAALSPVMQDLLVNLKAVHAPPAGYKESIDVWQYGEDAEARFDSEFGPREHPLVIEHPHSRRPSLFVNPSFTVRIAGMTDPESVNILRFLYNHMTAASFVYRHHWSPGDIVIWDELVCLHLPPSDFQPHDRRLVRIISGTVAPASPASQASAASPDSPARIPTPA
jgi:taurine dioxygenase